MDAPENGTERMLTKEDSAERLKTECKNLLSEIGTLLFSYIRIMHKITVAVGRPTGDVKK